MKKSKKRSVEDSIKDYLILVLIIAVLAVFMMSFIGIITGYSSNYRSCEDTDKGIMPYIKGTVTAVSKSNYDFAPKTDYCITINVGDYSYSYVKEYYCGSDPNRNQDFVHSGYGVSEEPCPNGCNDGACI